MKDIVILGAGLSGTTAALRLSQNFEIIVINQTKPESFNPVNKVFPAHNYQFLPDINMDDDRIFPKDHLKSTYMGTEYDGVIDSTQFGPPLGKICHYEELLKKLISKSEKAGVEFIYTNYPKKVTKHDDFIELKLDSGDVIQTKLLLISGGASTNEIQKGLGFSAPDVYSGISVNFKGSSDKILDNFESDYYFHINPNISAQGPFYMIKSIDRVSLGFLGNQNETIDQMKDKLSRILQNYKKLQRYLDGLEKVGDFYPLTVSKHPIKKMVDDRIMILGESAGLVTAFFYEGIIGALTSSKIASDLILEISEKNLSFSKINLTRYEDQLKKSLLNTYFETGKASEFLFYSAEKHLKLLFNQYANLLHSNKRARKLIYDAYRIEDFEQYNLENDKWVGEQIYQRLPMVQKVMLTPHFLKSLTL